MMIHVLLVIWKFPVFSSRKLISLIICLSTSGLQSATGLRLLLAGSAVAAAVPFRVCGCLIFEENGKIFP